MRICALGDLLLDVIVRVDEPIVPGADAVATTRAGAGGQAANVAAWVVALGGEGRFVGKRGDDAAGELASAELQRRGVDVRGPVASGGNGIVVSLVDAAGERTMLSDRGVAPRLRPDELERAWFADCDWLHLTGYSLLRSPIAEAAAAAAAMRGGRLSVDLSAWTAIREFGADDFRARVAALEPDAIFANDQEAAALGGDLPAPVCLIKHGAAGFEVHADGRRHVVEASGDAVDATGAGDALAAGFLVGGAELAADAARRCVSKLGAMP
ncbi:MAG TPA: carbohydrate kinase family protein [Gaiellaceae bacterium]